ncbi:MAG: CBS domain-containing protein [Shimia sp.]|uniref:CBS domain-containing protein n=1 Tax=Shimia sp. TaxID=1954381 RepID=UPI001B166F6C|nr:CBS domain-containing protein [Shimia sp.]MBO6898111.1 CBS domain-containing protein [Shimia sp.]
MTLTAHDIIEGKRPRLRDLIDLDLDTPQATLTRDSTVRDAMQIISKENRGGVVVLDEARTVVGIVSERDIVKNISAAGADVLDWSVDRIMTPSVYTASENTSCQSALVEMIDKRFRNMPVCNADGQLVACVETLQVAHVKLAELLEANRKLMGLLSQANTTQVTVAPNVSSATIKNMLNVEGQEYVIVCEEGKTLGFITQDEFLRALHRVCDKHAS